MDSPWKINRILTYQTMSDEEKMKMPEGKLQTDEYIFYG
jgi:hypothetical protein